MISVCMATYNGEKYIEEQIHSILTQLNENDELVISDDGSTDDTIAIIEQFNDSRIFLYKNKFKNHILNFEFVLKQAKGDYVFLSDQDDVWVKGKVENMSKYLSNYDLVCSDCYVTDSKLSITHTSFYNINLNNRRGFIRNFIRNNYLGCCMAFNRKILNHSLPFPDGLLTHDMYIGLISELYGSSIFIDEKLIYFRRHDHNTSCTLMNSKYSLIKKISYRLIILKGILFSIIRNLETNICQFSKTKSC